MTRELEFHAGRLPEHVDPDQEADRKTLNYALLAFRYRCWLVIGGLAGLLLGHAAYTKLGPEYEATAQILVSRRHTVPLREEQRTLGDWGERSEHIALIMSPMIASKAVELGKLRELPTFQKSPDPVEDVLDGLKVKRSSGQDRSYMNVLTLTYSSKNAAEARAVVQAMVAAYAAYLEETRHEKSGEVLSLAQQAHDEVLEKLRLKEQEYQEFRDQAPLQWRAQMGGLTQDGQNTTNVHQERVLAIEEQRRLNLLRQAELQSRLRAIAEAVENGEPHDALEVLVRRFLNQDGPGGGDLQRQQDLSIFENRLLPLHLEEQKLTRDYGPDHPDVKAVRQSIAAVKDFYRQQGIRLPEDRPKGPDGRPVLADGPDFIAIYTNTLRQQLAELQIRDRELAAIFAVESEKAKEVSRYQAQDQALNAELGRLRELWGQLVTQVAQVGIEKDGSGYALKQIAPVKDQLSLKRLLKFWGAGGVFGLGAVACLAVLRELRDTRLRTLEELRRILRQPLLGSVARFSDDSDVGAPLAAQAHPALRYLRAPHSHEAENYRSLRTALGIATEDQGAKAVLVASPEPGDGKTTTAANLAVALAQSGKRVLLVDADLRRPSVHRLFHISNQIGLVDILQGEIELLNAVQESAVGNLKLLPAGPPPSNPAELLSSPRLGLLLRDARDEFDVVLVDGPPLLAVSDPCVVARQTDGVLLVVRLGKSTVNTTAQARDLLRSHGLKVLGAVANSATFGDNGDYERGYYREYAPAMAADEVVAAT